MRNIFRLLLGDEAVHNLPLLEDAYKVEPDQHIEIGMDSSTLEYHVDYPSGLSRTFENYRQLAEELKRWVDDDERIEEMIRYATNWRRTAYFPSTGVQYIKFPDGRISFGGLGNRTR